MKAHLLLTVITSVLAAPLALSEDANWPQAAGPLGNWQTEGSAPLEWSATRNENILWRTALPETGMSNVTAWGDRLFVTTHVPIRTLEEKESVKLIRKKF